MDNKIFTTLRELSLDAYVAYDFRGSNYIVRNILDYQYPTTRRWVAIFTQEKLHLIIPKIEESLFGPITAEKHVYMTYQDFEKILKQLVSPFSVIATDYFSENNIPVLDIVPHGFFELLRSINQECTIVSSALLAQKIAAVWGKKGYQTHKNAADLLKASAELGWEYTRQQLKKNKPITDLDIENFILAEFRKHDVIVYEDVCVVSTNERASNPHYCPTEKEHYAVKPNSILLFDLWIKENVEQSIYADTTFMAWIGPKSVPKKIQEIWEIVRDARDIGVNFVKDNVKNGIAGFEIDKQVRDYIIQKGYGDYFVHRTGHSIDTIPHGSGTNIDNFETKDTREIISDTGFSIEPGIYLPEFGVRSELNMHIHPDGTAEVTTWQQKDLVIV